MKEKFKARVHFYNNVDEEMQCENALLTRGELKNLMRKAKRGAMDIELIEVKIDNMTHTWFKTDDIWKSYHDAK